MTPEKAAETIVDIVEGLAVDEYLQASAIEPIIQQCVDDTVEAVAVKVEEAYLTSPSVTMPLMLRSLARQIRAMKGKHAEDSDTKAD